MNNPLETLPTPVPGAPSADDPDGSGAAGFPVPTAPHGAPGSPGSPHLGVVPPAGLAPTSAQDAVRPAQPPPVPRAPSPVAGHAPQTPGPAPLGAAPPDGGASLHVQPDGAAHEVSGSHEEVPPPALEEGAGGRSRSRFAAPASVGTVLLGFGLFAIVAVALFALIYLRLGALEANVQLSAARAEDEFAASTKAVQKDVQALKSELAAMKTQLADPKTKSEIRRMGRAVHDIDQQIKEWAKAEQEQKEAAEAKQK